jgi:hypothetical protein
MDAIQNVSKNPQRTEEEISTLIERWRASGKNKKTFCRENDVNYMTFIGWTRPRPRVQKEKTKKSSSFIPLSINQAGAGVFAELNLPGGERIIFHAPMSAEYLLRFL